MEPISLAKLKQMLLDEKPSVIRMNYGDRLTPEGMAYLRQMEASEDNLMEVTLPDMGSAEDLVANKPTNNRLRLLGFGIPILLFASIFYFIPRLAPKPEVDAPIKEPLTESSAPSTEVPFDSELPPSPSPETSLQAQQLAEELEHARRERAELATELAKLRQQNQKPLAGPAKRPTKNQDNLSEKLMNQLKQAESELARQSTNLEQTRQEQQRLLDELEQAKSQQAQQSEDFEKSMAQLRQQNQEVEKAIKEKAQLEEQLAKVKQAPPAVSSAAMPSEDQLANKRLLLQRELAKQETQDASGISSRTFQERPDFENKDLSGMVISALDMKHSNFKLANLRGVRFEGTQANHCQFDRAKLAKAVFVNTSLIRCSFKDTDLSGVSFKNANLKFANLKDAVKWREITSLEGTNIYGIRNPPDGFRKWALSQGAIEKK